MDSLAHTLTLSSVINFVDERRISYWLQRGMEANLQVFSLGQRQMTVNEAAAKVGRKTIADFVEGYLKSNYNYFCDSEWSSDFVMIQPMTETKSQSWKQIADKANPRKDLQNDQRFNP